MKLTKSQLQKLIQEELARLDEATWEKGDTPVSFFRRREKEMGVGPDHRPGIDDSDEGGSDPLRDAVRDFVDAVKDHI